MIPPPPISTLFPYTTLFRSHQLDDPKFEKRDAAGKALLEIGPLAIGMLRAELQKETPDRKSTRLNSSHRCISYAVFCLKKKKNERKKRNIQKRKAYPA